MSFRNPVRFNALAIALCLLIAVGACSPEGGTEDDPAADAEDPENGGESDTGPDDTEPIGVTLLDTPSNPEPMLSTISLINELGHFEEQGLDVDIIFTGGGGPQKVQGLVAGEADIAIPDTIAMANARNEGAEVSSIAGASALYGATILAGPEYESVEELAGVTWGVPSVGGGARVITDLFLDEHGMVGEVEYLGIGGTPELIPALQSDRIQAATFLPSVLLHLDDPDLNVITESTAEVHDTYPNFVYAARDEFIEEEPEVIQRFLRAVIAGHRELASSPDAYFQAVDGMLPDEFEQGRVEEFWQVVTDSGYWAENGGVNLSALDTVFDLYYDLPDAPPDPTVTRGEQIYDLEHLEAVLDEVGLEEDSPDQPDWLD